MKRLIALFLLLFVSSAAIAQTADTLIISESLSKKDSTLFRRHVQYDQDAQLYHVTDSFLSGQIALQGDYLVIDRRVKEEFWNFHHTHIKHGYFRKWYDNGQLEWEGRFDQGLIEGKVSSWHRNGQLNFAGEYRRGMQQGPFAYYDESGKLEYKAEFKNGSVLQPAAVRYDYLTYLPTDYDLDPQTRWPLIIFLHGGTSRGSDLRRVKANGIPDRLERGKQIPFIVIAPQCPVDKRWETDDWFDQFFGEIRDRYRIDTSRIYLTGMSLGGSGTWYLAMKHPTTFAAIAPICGKTSHLQFLLDSACTLSGMPIWIFHGREDEVVDIRETRAIAEKLDQRNISYSLSVYDGQKHWQTPWEVYGGEELYSWFLGCVRR